MEKQAMRRVLFCSYKCGSPIGHSVGEDNFFVCQDGFCRGYAEMGNTPENYKRLCIEKIDIAAKGADEISGVTIVFCAKQSENNPLVIVGWYNNATVYRNIQKDNGRAYYFRALADNVHVVPPEQRSFTVPRANKDKIGPGRFGFWYAKKPEAQQFVDEALKYIDEQI